MRMTCECKKRCSTSIGSIAYGMLSITLLTLLITSHVISGIQAKEERKAQLNKMQTSFDGSDSVLEALKVLKGDTFNIVPESYVEQKDHAYKSQSGNRLRRDLFGIPEIYKDLDAPANKNGHFNYFASQTYQHNNVYNTNGEQDVVYGSIDVQIGNTFSGDSNATNVYGPTLVQTNNTYKGNNKNAQYGASVTQIGNSFSKGCGKNDTFTGKVVQKGNTYSENPKNKTLLAISVNQSNNAYPECVENNKDVLKPVIDQSGNYFPSSNDPEAGINTKITQRAKVDIAEQNAIDSQGSSSTNYDSSSHVENKTLHTKEKEAHVNQHFIPSSNDPEAGINTKNNTEGQADIAELNATDTQGNSSSTNNYDSSSHVENKTLHTKERVTHADQHFLPSSNDPEAGMNTKNNTEGQVDTAEQNATETQGNSSSTNYDSTSHVENKTLHTKERVTHADQHFLPSSNDPEAGMNTKNNTEGQVDTAEQNATETQGNSSSTNYDSSSHVENKTLHTKEKETHADQHFLPSGNDPEAGINTKNNTEGQVDIAEQNATDTQGSSSTNYDSSSHVENKTLHTKERETHSEQHSEPNRQMSLSSNVFYSLSYSLIILLKYSQF